MLPQATDEWTISDAAHLLRRAGFGGSPEEVARVHALGRREAVEGLLKPDEPLDAFPVPEWAERERALADARTRFEEIRKARTAAREMSPEEADKARRKVQQAFQRTLRQQGIEAQGWWFRRMMKTKAPLREKMVLFWHDHFATSLQKVKQPALLIRQNELFRDHAIGDFKALTQAILRDPAMMLYLDTQTSKKGRPNENFAREVMELFTLGEGNYSEQDIKEAARAFTGYSLDRATGTVRHNRRQWDGSTKTVFGRSGPFDGEQVIDLIFEQDAAAEYLPKKLWEFFVEDEAPTAVVKDLAGTFRNSGFRIEPVLREIFLSKAFHDPSVLRNQIKGPVQFLIQMFKELGLEDPVPGYTMVAQQQLGQVLFMPPNVAGWDWGKAWINTNTLLSRYNIAGVITMGGQDATEGPEEDDMMMEMAKQAGNGGGMLARVMKRSAANWQGPDYEKIAPRPLREDPAALVDSLIKRFFQAPLGPKERAAFTEYAISKKGVIFTNREVAELCHLMMSTPYYQLA